jgi:hypothetical protein
MIEDIRDRYNANFTEANYKAFLQDIDESIGKPVLFRIAETPAFIPESFAKTLRKAGDEILSVLYQPDFKANTEAAIPKHLRVQGDEKHPLFICVDFAVCKDENGELFPQLIEFQGFPSLFGWQAHVGQMFKKHFWIPDHYDFLIDCPDMDAYIGLLKKTILGKYEPENVILLEIRPEEQKTNADFYIIEKWLGIKPVCLSAIYGEDNKLYYDLNGKKTAIHRIYNRVIFDDLDKQEDFTPGVNLTDPWEVEWAEHPNWFFRISKYTMPMLNSMYVPETRFLHEVDPIPSDLSQYVLKPLFSFSGQGVIFDVKQTDIDAIPLSERDQYILQKKVSYEPVIKAPNGMVKAEVRLLYIWPEDEANPTLATNLVRLSKGVMIGVRYNENMDWVGGTVGFFPKKK